MSRLPILVRHCLRLVQGQADGKVGLYGVGSCSHVKLVNHDFCRFFTKNGGGGLAGNAQQVRAARRR